MPLRKGTDKETTRKNFEEFGRGKTYSRTKGKFGKKRADKQRIAVVLNNKRKSRRKKRRSTRRTK